MNWTALVMKVIFENVLMVGGENQTVDTKKMQELDAIIHTRKSQR